MEKYSLANDIKVFYITAQSFPDGIEAAQKKLHTLLPAITGRNFFGVSYPNISGKIIYKAAVAESYPGEAEELGCQTYIIRKGEYISTLLKNYINNIQSIDMAFKELLATPNLDPNGACVEMYLAENNMRCMIRLNS